MKIILDTNVILSSFITSGLSSRVLDICIDHHNLYISEFILNEVTGKLENKFKIPPKELKRIKNFLQNNFIFINPQNKLPSICRDKDDNNILQLAEFIISDLIITGDQDLLVIKNYNTTQIVSPRQFMEKFNKIN
jgi:putative PIN family toxin of toxin-antitoxin system